MTTYLELNKGLTFDEANVKEQVHRFGVDVLRPAAPGAIAPFEIEAVIGARALRDIGAGEALGWRMLGE